MTNLKDPNKEDIKKDKKEVFNNTNDKSNKTPIDKDMYIMEIVMNYPETLELFMEAGLHCVGCGLAQYETLEEGTMGHGWDEEDLNYLVEELNRKVKEIYGKKGNKKDINSEESMKSKDNDTEKEK